MKALFLSIDTQLNTCLSHELATFSCETRALADYLQKCGMEIWVHNPYKLKSKKSKIDYTTNIISTHELLYKGLNKFDVVITKILPIHIKKVSGASRWGVSSITHPLVDEMLRYKGTFLNQALDYRSHLKHPEVHNTSFWNNIKRKTIHSSLFSKIRYLFQTKIKPIVPTFTNSYREQIIAKDYTDFVSNNLADVSIAKWSEFKPYDFIYSGLNSPKKKRLDTIQKFTKGLKCRTVGTAKIKGWKSLSKYKRVKEEDLSKYTSQGKITLVTGESHHNFRTSRYWEAFISGGVMLIDSNFTAAAEHAKTIGLGDRIVSSSKDVINVLNTKNLKDLYEQQVEAFLKYKQSLVYKCPTATESQFYLIIKTLITYDNRKTSKLQAILLSSVLQLLQDCVIYSMASRNSRHGRRCQRLYPQVIRDRETCYQKYFKNLHDNGNPHW